MAVTTLKGTTWYFGSPYLTSYYGDYDLTFTSNNTNYTALHIEYGSLVAAYVKYDSTTVFTRRLTSASWTDNAYRTVYITGGTSVTTSTLINWFQAYATLQSVTVTYEAGDYGTGATQTVTKTAGTALTLLGSAYTRYDYIQDGWSVNSDGSTLDYQLGGSYSTDDSITLYPHWALQGKTVTFDVQGHGTAPAQQRVPTGGYATEPTAPTATGYTFGGWYKEAECVNVWNFSTDTVDIDTILYAKWTLTVYSITYNLDGGTVSESNPTTYTIETPTFTLNNPVKTGYGFNGWEGTGLSEATMTVVIPIGSYGNRSYTATYSIGVYTVTFNMKGHGTAPAPQTITYGGYVERPTDPTATGYIFRGWFKDSACTDPWNFSTDVVVADTVIYAKWSSEAKAYIGINNFAAKLNNGYVGVDGVARKITKGYVGIGGVARRIF